jgi:uncharacterized membrane protein YfhO
MAEGGTLAELRTQEQKASFSERAHKKTPWLFNWKSLFYFFLFVFFLGICWMAYSLFNNSLTQLYGWDYTWQYIDFTYEYYDTWHNFFKTGYFQLYSTGTFLGSDAIGSNSYYGLFDPFLFICYIFPRAWIPQTFATATIVKVAVSALTMRLYLRYMGCQETTSRLGAVAYAFCGYMNFFVGYPSFVSMCFTLPLVLLGIEKIIRERKPSYLIWGLFFLGIISFFFLVVICVWGVLYALFRFIVTCKSRNAKENWAVIGLGIAGFAIGIMLSAWTLLPSLRESTLSGRTTSIGSLYAARIVAALKTFDLKSFFGLMFSEVGGNNAREIQPLTAFFFPTCNYLWSPLMQGTTSNHYDSWTSSLFCYTPFVILFFTALVSSARRKKISHLVAFGLCCYLLFTNFAYYFFYAFTGDGYGRWYIVLIPEIIYYGAQELDSLKEEPKWVLPVGSFVSLFLTVLTWILVVLVVKDHSFASAGFTYVQPSYNVPGYVTDSGQTYSCLWMVYYQIGLVLLESVVMFYFQNKKYFWSILLGLVSVELIVCGNCSFAYGSSWSFQNSFDGGVKTSASLVEDFQTVSSQDSSYFRSYIDTQDSINGQNHYGFNGTSTFHSLYNFDVMQLAHYSHLTNNYTGATSIYSSSYYSVSWSAYYGNKRFGFDTAANMKYYVIQKDPYGNDEYNNVADNVPFGSTVVAGGKENGYYVYKNPNITDVSNSDSSASMIGHAVDSSYLYQAGTSTVHNEDNFYTQCASHSSTSDKEIIRNEGIYLNGAIIKNSDVDSLTSEGFSVQDTVPVYSTVSGMKSVDYSGRKITTNYLYYHATEGPAAFATDSSTVTASVSATSGEYTTDYDKFVYYPAGSAFGQSYFNTDPNGAYFLMSYKGPNTRIYMIGDTFDSNGNLLKTNQLLCYEYKMIRNYNAASGNGDTWGNALFGFYPRGRVRYIVFCAMPSDYVLTTTTLPSDIRLYMMERSDYDTQLKKIQGGALTNVQHWTDNFTCESNYSEKKLVVTALGYDEGWRVLATDENGKQTQLKTYKLDGGFVGFVAPAGKTKYHLFFQTKYLKEGALLAMAGFGMYILFEGIVFLKDVRRERQAMGIVIEKKPFDWHLFKKKDDSSSPHQPNGP